MKFNKNKLLPMLLVLAGNIIFALTVKLFLLPANLISCGATGLALVVNHLTSIPIPWFIFGLNVVMLAVGWIILGRQFALTTVFSSLFYPIALEVLDLWLGNVQITQDMLLNVIFAAIGLGGSLGMVIRGGASTGGMDIPPLVLNKLFRIPVPVTLWVSDFIIMLCQMMFHPAEDLLYGVLMLIVLSIALNKVLLLGTSKTEVKIVSPNASQIRDVILSKVDRGVTMLSGEGGYSQAPTQVILSVVSNHELPKIERMAREIDPGCFIIVSRVTEVWGRGFSLSRDFDKDKT